MDPGDDVEVVLTLAGLPWMPDSKPDEESVDAENDADEDRPPDSPIFDSLVFFPFVWWQ